MKNDFQMLSTLRFFFFECDKCNSIVGSNEAQQGNGCPICKTPNRVRSIYNFGEAVHSLIDLMLEFYYLKKDTEKTSTLNGNHRLAVVIFFCTLGEVLLDGFLRESMDKVSIQDKLQEKLFNDNKSIQQKLDLFKALTGVDFKEEAAYLSLDCELDYSKVLVFHKSVKDARNSFLHTGYKNMIDIKMPEKCLSNVWPLLNFFVALHNRHIGEPGGQ